MTETEGMQRTAKCKLVRVGYAGGYVLCGLAFAIFAGCGGSSDTTTAAAPSVSATEPVQTAPAPASVTNSPATISGTPATQAQSGQVYSFTPSAADSDGDTLTFSVQNKPSWASFSTTSGQLSGTPTSAQVGSYSNIVISVTDGTSATSLAPFSITVAAAPASTGSALLTWNAPVANTDGSPVVDLAGFKIAYGTSSGSLTQTVTVSDPTASSYTLQGLTAGTWYFAVSVFTSTGTASALSSVVSKTIQ
jgi:hypothetical protein